MPKDYHLGLDIGTGSIGFAATDDNNKLIRAKGKNIYGVRLFDEGQPASERRSFRTTRRRLSRRGWRLKLLREIFEPYIYPQDPSFFMRQKYSSLSAKDPNQKKDFTDLLFSDRTDADFYQQYPTIYHLREALMTEHRQFDLREIYLAVHHIVKYRGHFLDDTLTSKYKFQQLELRDKFEQLNQNFQELQPDQPFTIDLSSTAEIEAGLIDQAKSKSDRQKELMSSFYLTTEDKDIEKQEKSVAAEILKLILGNKAQINVILGEEVDPEAKKDWKLTFDSETFDTDFVAISTSLTEVQMDIMTILEEIYSALTLKEIIGNNNSLSGAMVEKYDDHHEHLQLLKQVARQTTVDKGKELRLAYDYYITGKGKDGKAFVKDDFYKLVEKSLDESAESQRIKQLIDTGHFMPKQRTKENGAIPHQIHQKELDLIIENQKAYYPWLAELNPNEKRRHVANYKLDELVSFRVPYYVGPMITAKDQKKTSGAGFAWMIRREDGTITPWNFDEKVDRIESANKFIKRMTTTDTYLIGEDVLPASSLIYQRYNVLNELNNIRINGHKIEFELKEKIYQDLFMKTKSISVKKFKNYLLEEGEFKGYLKVTGFADEDKFNSNLGSYIDFKKILGDLADDNDKQADIEQMIEWSTIFEDKQIYETKLEEITWLTPQQRVAIANKRYTGWGRLSRKLLTGLRNQNNQNMMDLLWSTEQNFMQIQAEPDFAELIAKENQNVLKEKDSQKVIDELYTSPQNKKAIRQILLVVVDIKRAMHGQAPTTINVEFARGEDKNPRRTVSRQRQIENLYQKVANEILISPSVREELSQISDGKKFNSDRLFLYFSQGGRDMYTNEAIDIDKLSSYDIDHILPQAFIKDDSLDNRVLVSQKINREKSDAVPRDLFGARMMPIWEKMADKGLISKRKLANLKTDPDSIDAFKAQGFINRQLVETRQVIKLAVGILADQFGDETKIISVKANLTHQLRETFDWVKNRDVNDYHHAFDAYLTVFVGNYLLRRYPKLESYFVYGNFKKFTDKNAKFRNFNFLYDLNLDEIMVDRETGEILKKRQTTREYINGIYGYKKILVTHEVHENHGALYNMTVYGRKDNDKRKLIPIKNNMPTDVYGGYSSRKLAYMAIVKTTKEKTVKYLTVGIPISAATKIDSFADDKKHKVQMLNDIVRDEFDDKTQVEVIVPKVLFRQLIIDDGCLFTLGSDTYRYNAQQLILNVTDVKIINAKSKDVAAQDETERGQQLIQVYDDILLQVQKYFPLYDIKQFRTKFISGREKFIQFPNNDIWNNNKVTQLGKITIIQRILQGLHANAAVSDLKNIDMGTPLGKIQVQNRGISPNAVLIYQSPTGLFERRVKLSDLDR
ncbi:type II CRISPR RNA-guided endonuclease Cas9 [Lapidilactobacillus mulanensis]|uniref:CRISPR-associated endonuclease Cas9 n=1 Tax=Lapidilactobacillus mulanensis TaxID=2485999 RepID=A0ABW4DNV9_9LACO|nr:type II CRISPR RNA-guided endonuclease Cas9 [Lapidilactobacillus mulanensis]